MIFIEIPFKTPTVNHLYFNWKGRMIKTTTAKKMAAEIEDIVLDAIEGCQVKEYSEKKLRVEVEVYEDWWYKNGSVARKDLMNREKFLIDSIFKALDIDDRFIFEVTFKKCQNEEREFAHVKIFVEDEL